MYKSLVRVHMGLRGAPWWRGMTPRATPSSSCINQTLSLQINLISPKTHENIKSTNKHLFLKHQ